MNDQPLQAFSLPSISFAQFDLLGIPSGGALITWALYIIFAFWAVYTFVAIYHWLKYSHASWLTFPAIATHLFISFALMSYALSGSASFLTPYLP